ncbi:MAG: phosphate ABC transporter permease PstA [Polyangiaceae bacterium]
MSTTRATILHVDRRGARRENVLLRLFGAFAMAILAAYVVALGYLLVLGGGRAMSFTAYPTPLAGVEGEVTMRVVLAFAVFGGLAWAVLSAARALHDLVRGPDVRVDRGLKLVVTLVAVLGAAFFRDHLPRFLVSMPSETTAGGGVGPEIFNTVYFAVLSTLVTVPIGVGAALYMARFADGPRFVGAVRTALDTLSSLPSIVYGLFGFLVFVVGLRAGYSLLAGAFVLALLNLPLVVGIAEESIRSVPRDLEDASLALGATPVQTAFRVTLPYAWPGILSALVLSIGRVFAESAPLIMTAGTTISRTNAYSLNPFRGGETLAVHLWYVNSSGLSPDKAEVSAGTAAVLVLLIVATNTLSARFAKMGGAAGGRFRRATR